jgi:hypothetical protein
MPSQQTFLGASISSFDGVIGWGSEPTTLSTTLVVDDKNGDWFNPPPVGHTVVFNYDSWVFRGILQSWKHQKGESGFVYSVVCHDPREVLEGYQIILGGYTRAISVPNVANLYGYLESFGFGNSKKNETGIPWRTIQSNITTIVNSSNAYGGPVSLRGEQYSIDLSALPSISSSYRVAGDEISLMGFIAEICDAGSHDYFINLLPGNILKVNTIDRSTVTTIGALSAFIDSTPEVTSSQSGVEFKNEVNGKLLLGGTRIDMYGQNKGGQDIWPFWGFETNSDLKMGTGFDNDHEVELDTTSVEVPGVGATYTTNVLELRMVLESQDSWETFLLFKKGAGDIHDSKYDDLKLVGTLNKEADPQRTIQANMQTEKNAVKASSEAIETDHEEAIHRLYSFLLGYARDFYGKRFIVSIPTVDGAKEPDTDKIRVSLEPADAGFIDPSEWDTAVSNNKLPQDFIRLATDDGRFPAYARFDNVVDLDFSEVPDTEIVYNDSKTSAFVKCSTEAGVAFETVSDLTGPRAAIILAGPVRKRTDDGDKTDFGGLMRRIMQEAIDEGPANDTDLKNLINQFGVDNAFEGEAGLAALPNFVAVPLQNNKEVYGPWQIVGANGKMDIESDSSLVPWNYGGYDEMDIVGNAQVQDNVSYMQELETGSIEMHGVPTFTMGQQLVASGPYITDIDVSVGEQGITSLYKFSTWTPRFGRVRKSNIQRFSILAKKSAKAERQARERKIPVGGLGAVEQEIRSLKKTKRKGGTSSHGVLSGEGVIQDEVVRPNVFVQPHYNFTSQLGHNYDKKAGVSLDGLFRPFTTNPSGTDIGMPYFRTPTSGAEFPTATDLNPYQSGHDIVMALRGSSLPDDLILENDPYFGEDYRSMAFRGPMVMAGPGYDTEGKPVPNESGAEGQTPTDSYASGYLTDQSTWPVGPVYMPWDNDRKCWVGGGGSKNKLVRIIRESGGADFPSEFAKAYHAEELVPDFDGFDSDVTVEVVSGDPFLVGNYRQNIVLENAIYVTTQFNGKYYLDNQTTFAWGNL